MNISVLSTTIVILAQDHNPTILHPSFLVSQGIIPKEQKLLESPLCTPAFALVKYNSGIVFSVEINRFQVADSKPPEDFRSSEAPSLARKYIEKLEYVRYTAVGVNFTAAIEQDHPESFIIRRFLVAGPWNDDKNKMSALGLRFVYQLPQATLTWSCDAGQFKRAGENETRKGIVISGNYQCDVTSESVLDDTKKAISRFPEYCDHFSQITKTIIET